MGQIDFNDLVAQLLFRNPARLLHQFEHRAADQRKLVDLLLEAEGDVPRNIILVSVTNGDHMKGKISGSSFYDSQLETGTRFGDRPAWRQFCSSRCTDRKAPESLMTITMAAIAKPTGMSTK